MSKLASLPTVALLVLVTWLLVACTAPVAAPTQGGAATNEQVASPEATAKTLRVNLGTYPDMIDPQKSSFSGEIAHLNLVYQGLTALNEKLETVPGAAEAWQYNDDATQLTFTLRDGLVYNDGAVLNAARFAYSIFWAFSRARLWSSGRTSGRIMPRI